MAHPRFPAWAAVAAALLATGAMGAEPARGAELRSQARVAITFAPGPPPKVKPSMVERLARRPELALGFLGSTLGSYSPDQVVIDMSAGARTWASLYEGDPPRLRLIPSGGRGRMRGWDTAIERAKTPPADIAPGTLAAAVRRAGGRVVYVSTPGGLNREAAVAADRAGDVERVALAAPGSLGRVAVRLWKRSALLVTRLPAGPGGTAALTALLAERRPADAVLVVQQPPPDPRRLLATGAAGLGEGRALRSSSTRTDGLVIAPDVAATVLERLGIPIPDEVAGQPIEAKGDRSVEDLTELRNRLAEVGPRRWPVTLAGLAAAAALAALLSLPFRGPAWAAAVRVPFLVALWLPTVLLATGALAPSWLGELAMVAGAGALLAVATDRLLPPAAAVALPAGVTLVAHGVDLAFGSPLIGRSLLGPNPILGARFYGVGNELEVTLASIGLLGLGGALAGVESPRARAWGFALGGALLAFVLSWGKLGADVGASVMLATGTAAAVAVALGGPLRRPRLAAVIAAPVLGLAALALLDLVTGGDAHFTRSVLRAGGLEELADTVQRRFELSYRSLRSGATPFLVALAVLGLVWGVTRRHRLLAPLRGAVAPRAALTGALVAVLVGALANDSGPYVLLIGTVYLGLAVAYLQGVRELVAKGSNGGSDG